MGNLRLYGSTSGYVEIAPPAVGGSQVLTLPTDSVQPGMVLVASQTFSAASSVSVNSCFTSAYRNYRVMLDCATSVDQAINVRMRLSGTDASGNDYSQQYIRSNNTSISGSRNTSTSMMFGTAGTNGLNNFSTDIFTPALATQTTYNSNSLYVAGGIGPVIDIFNGLHAISTAYDGLTIFVGGNITGTVKIYGYRN